MLLDVRLQLVQVLPVLLHDFRELQLGLGFRFAERHLHAAVRVDLAFARRFDRQEDHVLVVRHHRRLRAVRLRRGHAAERLQRQHHVRQFFVGVVNVLRDFQVTFAAARARVVVRMSQPLQFVLVNETMTGAAECVDDAVIFAREDHFRSFQLQQLVAVVPLDLGLLVDAPLPAASRRLLRGRACP